MKMFVDIVNMNGEASCLSSVRWLEVLQGHKNSELFRWLSLYTQYQKKVTLGLTGITAVDILKLNPEAVEFINNNPSIFEVIIRPFSHDISLLRTTDGFKKNLLIGQRIIEKEFSNVSRFFLPPEFMLTNEQVSLLANKNIQAVFINSFRFPREIKNRIPTEPYEVHGISGTKLGCVPIDGGLTFDYLKALHNYNSAAWNKNIMANTKKYAFSWRDGESSFLIPDGIKREEFWLKNESKNIQRKHLRDLRLNYISSGRLAKGFFKSYPVHSFSTWMEGLRMLGFLKRIQRIEENIKDISKEQLILWLHAIGSDILSAVEKKSPIVKIKINPKQKGSRNYIIQRSERGFEGEEYLFLLEKSIRDDKLPAYILTSSEAHLLRLRNKIDYLKAIIP